MDAAHSKRRMQRRWSQPNPLTLPYCSVHLRGVLELQGHIFVRDLPLPCLPLRQPLQFKLQGTPSDNTCSSSKGRGCAWNNMLPWAVWCTQGCLFHTKIFHTKMFHEKRWKCSKRCCQRGLVQLPAQSRIVTSARWGQPWLFSDMSGPANLHRWSFAPLWMICFSAATKSYEKPFHNSSLKD